jgi:hypothetical protein
MPPKTGAVVALERREKLPDSFSGNCATFQNPIEKN